MRSHLLNYFRFGQLASNPEAQAVSAQYAELARKMRDTLPDGPESTVALRKLMESKDCAVRAMLPTPQLDLDGELAAYERQRKPTVETPAVGDVPEVVGGIEDLGVDAQEKRGTGCEGCD